MAEDGYAGCYGVDGDIAEGIIIIPVVYFISSFIFCLQTFRWTNGIGVSAGLQRVDSGHPMFPPTCRQTNYSIKLYEKEYVF